VGDMADDVYERCFEYDMMNRRREVDAGVVVGEGKVTRITERALLVEFPQGEKWVPKSQLHENSVIDDASLMKEEGTVIISSWLAKQGDWPDFLRKCKATLGDATPVDVSDGPGYATGEERPIDLADSDWGSEDEIPW